MGRPVVRFYDSKGLSEDGPSVLHRGNCKSSNLIPAAVGRRVVMNDGWWERFGSEAEARETATRHAVEDRNVPANFVKDAPPCCP